MQSICTTGSIGLDTSPMLEDRTGAIWSAAAGGVLGLGFAKLALHGGAIRIAMSAFRIDADAWSVLAGFGGVLVLGLFGTAPAVWRIHRLAVASALKEP